MIITSEEYKKAIKADTETDDLEVAFEFMPPGSVEDSSVNINNPAEVSLANELNTGTYNMGGKWATLEPNRFLLDGSYELIDKSNRKKLGYWSENLCDANGNFGADVFFIYTMDKAYDIIGVQINFDELGKEWATNLTVEYYNSSDNLIASKTVNNSQPIAQVDFIHVGVKKFIVKINTWNIPIRRAKIAHAFPGQIYLFTPANSYEFELTEEIKPFENSLTLPEYTIKFDNSNSEFNIVNPEGTMSFLRQKMRISAKMGIKVGDVFEYVNVGKYYIHSWPQNTQEDTASFTCRPSMAFENNVYVATGAGTQTVEQAAAIIFSDVVEKYTIDDELKNIVVNQFIGEDITKLEAMGMLAVAAGSYWKFERDGSYSLKKWKVPNVSNNIDYDNMWEKPAIQQGIAYTSVNVKYYTYNSDNQNLEDNDSIYGTTDGAQKVITCAFIPNAERAQTIGSLALQYYNYRLSHNVDFRGDPSIEASDNIRIQNDYTNNQVLITKNNVKWNDNGIEQNIEGIGVS